MFKKELERKERYRNRIYSWAAANQIENTHCFLCIEREYKKIAKEFFPLTIQRSKWGDGVLYNPESNKYCILGWLCKAGGLSNEKMVNEKTILKFANYDSTEFNWSAFMDILNEQVPWPKELWAENPERENSSYYRRNILYIVNDAKSLSQEDKEDILNRMLWEMGFYLEFKD